jgi:thiamine-phosphate pyrophosphorylase
MRQTTRELVREAIAAFNRRDLDALFAHATPDAVFDWSRSIGPQRGIYRGPAEGREWLASFLEAWDEFTWNPEEVIELDAEHALLVNRVRGRGKGSGVEVKARGAQLWTIRGGRISAVRVFQNKENALATFKLERARLYFVCEARPRDREPRPLLRAALEGGADLVQLREKGAARNEELIDDATPFREEANEHEALFILNDRPDLVEACRADGVHVGQEDMPVDQARRLAGGAPLVGLSTHSPEQLDAACSAEGEAAPDYLSVGPVWETPTKEGRPAAGIDFVRYAVANATVPWFAIGGIDTTNIGEVVAAGAERVVVVRAIRDADDPEAAARDLRAALQSPSAR